MRATVVILTKLPGHLPVKTRLWPALGERAARDLYVQMLQDTVELARALCPRPIVAYSPPEADPRAALPGVADCEFLPVAGDDAALCLERALAAAYEGQPLLALGGDAPDLPVHILATAVAALEDHDAALIPSLDGGFSGLGLRQPIPGLARGFRFGSGDALARLLAFLASRRLSVARLEPWPDVDTPADLLALRQRCTQRSLSSRESRTFRTCAASPALATLGRARGHTLSRRRHSVASQGCCSRGSPGGR